jgi:putative ABC transport system permease protein
LQPARAGSEHIFQTLEARSMKYAPLVWKGLWHKPVRATFTLLSVIVAFFLFGMLRSVSSSVDGLTVSNRLDRLIVNSSANLPLPRAYESQIGAVDGVRAVVPTAQMIGYYQSPRKFVITFATEPRGWFDFYNGKWQISPQHLAALERTRTGAVISAVFAETEHLKVGDRVPIRSFNVQRKDGAAEWALDIVGIFDIPNDKFRTQPMLVMNLGYLDEARAGGRGNVQSFRVITTSPGVTGRVTQAIDTLFTNSPAQTRTQTERQNAESQIDQLGELSFFVNSIVSAVFFTLLFLTGNTLGQSFRERIPEFAVLKTLGFSDLKVFVLVLVEAMVPCIAGAAVGLLLARLALPLFGKLSGVVAVANVPSMVIVTGLIAATVLALAGGLPPAWRARRLGIIESLADPEAL